MGIWLIAVLLLAVLEQVSAELTVGAYNYLVDPGRIYAWRQKWMSSQIELSKSNQGATGVDVTFYVNPSTGLSKGIFEVTFPTGFDLKSVSDSSTLSVTGQVVQLTQSFPSDTDIRITIPRVANPSNPGAYGPFAIRTRLNPTGQIIDANLSFGSVYVGVTEGKLSAFTVAYASGSVGTINRAGNALTFQLTLTKSLWAHDVFKVTVPWQFTLVSPTCRSVDLAGKVNNYNGTVASDVHSLDCVATDKVAGSAQVLWIYGLASDADMYLTADNHNVQLSVTGFTNPDRCYPDTSYAWTMETLRFNTYNVLESGIATGPKTTPGTITTAVWTPTWGRSTSSILRGQTLYMDMTLTLVDPLTAGGSVEVTHSGKTNVWGATQCYLVTNTSPNASCTVDASQTTKVTGLVAIPAGGQIIIRHLITFADSTTPNQILSITSKSTDAYQVDTAANLAGFTFPAAAAANPITLNVLLQMAGTTNANQAGGPGSGTNYLKLEMKGVSGLITPTTTITISCPVAATVDDDLQFYFSGIQALYKTSSDSTKPSSDFSIGTNGLTVRTKTADPNTYVTLTTGSMTVATTGATTYKPGTISFQAVTGMTTDTDMTFGLYGGSTTNILMIPRVVSNQATAYECAVDIANTATSTIKPASGVGQFSIDYQIFDSSNCKFTYFCSRGTLDGVPIRISFSPYALAIRSDFGSRTYYVDIEMPAALYDPPGTGTFYNSGVKEGGVYPMDSTISGTPSMTVQTAGGAIVHRMKSLGAILPGSPVDVFFPVNKPKTSDPTAKIKLSSFYTLSTDLRVKYYTHLSSFTNGYLTDSTGLSDGISFLNGLDPSNHVNGNRLDTATIDFTLQTTSTVLSDTYFFMILPRGYSFSSFRDVLVYTNDIKTQVSFPWKKYFSSPSLTFAFPGVLVKTLAGGARISAASPSVLSLRGLNLPIGTVKRTATFVHSNQNGDLTAECLNSGTFNLQLTTGYISTITVSPQTVFARGPGGVDATYTLIFILPHGIDQGGSVKLSLNAEWSATSSTACTVSGLSDISSTQTVSCSGIANDFTVSNFADFNTAVNTKVTILLTHLLSPKNTNTDRSSQVLQSVKSLGTYTSDGLMIDTFDVTDSTVNGLTKVTVLAPLATGSTNYISTQIFPPNANIGLAEMYVKVSFPYDLPASSSIVTNPPYPPITATADMREKCHLSPLRYTSCAITASTFTIILGEDYKANTSLEIYVHQGVTAPTEVPATTAPVGFKITTSWFGVTITDDSAITQYTVKPKVTGTITAGTTAIDFSPKNAYESATYTLTFTSSVPVKATDKIIVGWPADFDPYLGVAEQSYETETGSFYVSCSSTLIGTAYCVMDHWFMLVHGTQDVEAAKEITITVSGVRNPPTGTTGTFLVWHVNRNLELQAINVNIGKVTTTGLAKELDIRKVDASSRFISHTADYSFEFYLSDAIGTSTELWFVFPPELAISMLTGTTDFPCAATYSDQSGAGKADVAWNSNTSCKLRGKDTVVLPAPTAATSFTSVDQVNVKIAGLPTPEWALERYPKSAFWDFDDIDPVVWTVYSWWTSQFKIFVYQTDANNRAYLSRPYSQQNAAYLGFLQPLRTFVVNSYNPQNKNNRVVVYPGTQSMDIPIMTANNSWPLEAKYVTFSAKVNANTPDGSALTFTSFRDNWVMLQDEWLINFRVSAAANALKGLYLVTWSITEGKQPTVSSNWYSPPPQTLVEVPAFKANVYSFSVDDIPPIPVGTTSLPVSVWVSNAPQSDVAVNIEVQAPYNETVSVSPSTLSFVPDLNSLYFNITVSPDHDFEYAPRVILLLNVTGTNAAEYSVSPAISISINKAYYPTTPKIATIGVADITSTSFTIAPSTDQLGVIYYAVSPRGAKVHSIEELKELMPTFTYTTDQLTADGKKYADERTAAMALSDPPADVEWNDFQHQLYSAHMTSYVVYGAVMMRTTTTNAPITIGKLWADSVYQVVAYLDNLKLNGTVSAQYLKYVWTLPIADLQPVSLAFAGDVAGAQNETIRNVLAKYIGVNPARLQNAQRTVQYVSARRLDTTTNSTGTTTPPPVVTPTVSSTTFQFYLVANRSLDWPTPTLEATFSNERENDLVIELRSTLAFTGAIDYSLPAIPVKVIPTWLVPAQLLSYTNSTATVQYLSSLPGKVCCAAMSDSQAVVIPDQVVEGYSYNWTKVPSACGAATHTQTVDTLDLLGLVADTVYNIHCVAMDDLPLWPTLMTYTTANPMPFVSFHTPLTNDPEIIPEAGIALQLAAILWLFLA